MTLMCPRTPTRAARRRSYEGDDGRRWDHRGPGTCSRRSPATADRAGGHVLPGRRRLAVSLVSSLSVREYPTTLVSPSLARGDSLGAAVASTERTARLERAELSGATVIDWDLDSPIDVALRASLADLFSVNDGRHNLASDPDALDQPRHRHRRDGAAGRRTAGNRFRRPGRARRCGHRCFAGTVAVAERLGPLAGGWNCSGQRPCAPVAVGRRSPPTAVVSLGPDWPPFRGVRRRSYVAVAIIVSAVTAVFGATAATRGVVDTERVGTYGGVVVRTTAVPFAVALVLFTRGAVDFLQSNAGTPGVQLLSGVSLTREREPIFDP